MLFNELNEILIKDGKSYLQYTNETINYIDTTDASKLDDAAKSLYDYTKLNLQRSARIDKTFLPSEELKKAVTEISENQTWMVITENWCGDSAQILPVIAKTALLSDKVELKIIGRDSHPEIMNLYLTNGTRSIPVFVAFDEAGNQLFKWGPRPKAAIDLVKQLKDDGTEKSALYEKLHLWYGRNRGAEIDKELLGLIRAVSKEISTKK